MQNNKQILSSLTRRNIDRSIDPYRIPDASSKINAKWSQEEQLLGVQGNSNSCLNDTAKYDKTKGTLVQESR